MPVAETAKAALSKRGGLARRHCWSSSSFSDCRSGTVSAPWCTRIVPGNGRTSQATRPPCHVIATPMPVIWLKERVKDASRALGLVRSDIYALQERFDMLAQINAGEAELETVASIIAPWPTDPGPDANADARIRYERDRKRAQEERAGLWKLYQFSPTVDRGTRWGVFNAATEYLDWYQERRGQNPNSANEDWMERRAVYSLEGGQEIRQRIFAALSA